MKTNITEETIKKIEKNYNIIIVLLLITFIIMVILIIHIELYCAKRECHTETEMVKIEVGCGAKTIPANAKRLCDDGIRGSTEQISYDNIVWDCNFDNITRYCVYEDTKKVCEIK